MRQTMRTTYDFGGTLRNFIAARVTISNCDGTRKMVQVLGEDANGDQVTFMLPATGALKLAASLMEAERDCGR